MKQQSIKKVILNEIDNVFEDLDFYSNELLNYRFNREHLKEMYDSMGKVRYNQDLESMKKDLVKSVNTLIELSDILYKYSNLE